RRSSDLYFRSKLPGQVYVDGLLWAWAYVLAKVVQSDSTVRRLPASWAFASPPLVFYCIFLYLSGFVRCSKPILRRRKIVSCSSFIFDKSLSRTKTLPEVPTTATNSPSSTEKS